MGRSNRLLSLAYVGLCMALLSVTAQIQIPIGLVPITLQSMIVIITILVFTPSEALLAISGYLLMGTVGLPVGAGFRGGLGWLLGPTGGFLLGFLLSAFVIAVIKRGIKKPTSKVAQFTHDICFSLVTLIIYYSTGVIWLMLATEVSLPAALSIAVMPFLLPDVIKLAVAVTCSQTLRKEIDRASVNSRIPQNNKLRP